MYSYLAHLAAAGHRPATIYLRRSHLTRVTHVLGDLHNLTSEELEAYIGRPGLSREYRRSLRSSLRGYYAFLQSRGDREDNPAGHLPRVKPAPPKPRPTPELAYQAAIARAASREELMLRLAAEAGLRRGEVCKIHSNDLVQDLTGWSLVIDGKGGRGRLVPVTESLRAALTERIITVGPGYLFPGQDHGHLSAAYVGKIISRLLPEGVTMHSLRHRFATRVYSATSDLLACQQLLGHASPVTTQIYVAIDGARLRGAVQAAA